MPSGRSLPTTPLASRSMVPEPSLLEMRSKRMSSPALRSSLPPLITSITVVVMSFGVSTTSSAPSTTVGSMSMSSSEVR